MMTFASKSTATFNAGPESTGGRGAPSGTPPRTWSAHTAAVVAKLREFAPYAAMELVMPGGSLMALGLWLYRRQRKASLLPRTARSERRRFGKPQPKHRVVEGIVATGT
jgi:hypothetical protein